MIGGVAGAARGLALAALFAGPSVASAADASRGATSPAAWPSGVAGRCI